jgi:hypothetical protein
MSFHFKIDKDDGSSVTLTQPIENESHMAKMNRLAKECGFDNISSRVLESLDWGNATSTTVVFNRNAEEAFSLVAPVAGGFREYQREGIHRVPADYRGAVGFHRALIGYGVVARCDNAIQMATMLKPIIEQGVKDLINQFGNINYGYKITMQMLGYEGRYFIDRENAAGYEIRLLLIKE